jgi:hypothetical protein
MAERSLEFFGAFVFWMFHRFKGKLADHYSMGSGPKQLANYFIGFLSVISIGIAIAWIKAKISDSGI